MKKLTTLAVSLLVLLPGQRLSWLAGAEPSAAATVAAEPGSAASTVVHGTIGRRDTIAAVLSSWLRPEEVARLVAAARPVHDLARIVAGRPFSVAFGGDGAFRELTYAIDELRTLRVSVRDGRPFAQLQQRDYEKKVSVVAGTIASSLFGAVESAGEGDQLALDLAEIFQWDVDFHTEIQSGDSFRVLVEKLYLDGSLSRYGRVLAAEFVRGSRTLRAVRHEGAAGAGYYGPDGRPLRKAFLRSPLRFTRISSRFSRSRLHPVLGIRRPHLGIDYAAPRGTPVHAAGDGIVVVAGWLGGYGRTVRLRHPNGYETLYGHLSRIDVRRGQRVTQGARLGAVGSTGLSTGPHLDYRMARAGRFVDPLRVPTLQAEPIARRERAAFDAAARRLLQQLAQPPDAIARQHVTPVAPPAPKP